jgi:hypothetical protein
MNWLQFRYSIAAPEFLWKRHSQDQRRIAGHSVTVSFNQLHIRNVPACAHEVRTITNR